MNTRDMNSSIALMVAANEGNIDIVQVLIEAGADVIMTRNNGWIQLISATQT